MAVFKYVEEGFVCYLFCDRPEVNSAGAFRGLCREVFAKACPVTVGTTFGVGLLPALTDDPAENLARFAGIDGGDREDFLGEYPERVREAFRQAGVSLENLGYYYHPDEVDEAAAAERDRAAEVYGDAVVVEDFDLTDLRRCPFCGAPARVYRGRDSVLGGVTVAVECSYDMCAARIGLLTTEAGVDVAVTDVVSAWNRRAGE